ncbi:helix-turn-helix domain-containing protein [Rhodococcus sp. IEGM 1379]|uniref:PucR family transcriptional regulator n=1 Tax=Rhodococcus sp. IEGM 1379 TaxID=3047086 RepID=UPI0024B6396F|nr:helix-turn-helix domain-containing protein [Rhodococcus sp. IEGM 1379]MDI9915373.1 helix-turn-helix domain-containing protein [Rhodococcus sp. IEGM 1379]
MPHMSHDDLVRTIEGLRRSVPQLATRAIDRYVSATPIYSANAFPAHLNREGAHTTRAILDLCLQSVIEEIGFDNSIHTLFDRAVTRVSDGVPLGEYIRAAQTIFNVLADELHLALENDPETLWFALCRARISHDRLLRDLASAYEVDVRNMASEQLRSQALGIDALLRGETWTFDDGERVPASPVVAFLHIADTVAEGAVDKASRIVARKGKVRYLSTHLRRTLPELWLMEIRPSAGRLLLKQEPANLDSVIHEAGEVIGAEVTMGLEKALTIADIPRAGKTAADVLAVGIRCGFAGKVIHLSDVALQLHFANSSSALPALLNPCAPLRNRPELVETLRTYLALDQDRRKTADALIVHPNTVDNRLIRVRELTGLDVRVTKDLLTLAIAVSPAVIPPTAS